MSETAVFTPDKAGVVRKYGFSLLMAAFLIFALGTYLKRDAIMGYVGIVKEQFAVSDGTKELKQLTAEYVMVQKAYALAATDAERKIQLDNRAVVLGRIHAVAAKMDPTKVPAEAQRFLRHHSE